MGEKIRVYVEGIGEVYTQQDTTLKELSEEVYGEDCKKYLGARINNEIYHLWEKVKEDMYIKFLDICEKDGHRIYERTISAVFIMACKEVFPNCTAKIEHSLDKGLYAELEEENP